MLEDAEFMGSMRYRRLSMWSRHSELPPEISSMSSRVPLEISQSRDSYMARRRRPMTLACTYHSSTSCLRLSHCPKVKMTAMLMFT